MGTLYNVDGTTGDITTAGSITSTSTTSGFLLPKLTTTQRDAIVSPATGLEIFNTTTNQLEFYNGTSWAPVGGSGSPGGADTQIQFNSSGSFAGDSNLTWDGSEITIGGLITIATNQQLNGVTSMAAGNDDFALTGHSSHSILLQAGDDNTKGMTIFSDGSMEYDAPGGGSILLKAGALAGIEIDDNVVGLGVPMFFDTLTTTQRNALTPSASWMIYNTTTNQPEVYNGSVWVGMSGGGSPGGSSGDIQWNSSGSFAGATNITTDGTNLTMTSGTLTTTSMSAVSSSLSVNIPTASGNVAIHYKQGGTEIAQLNLKNQSLVGIELGVLNSSSNVAQGFVELGRDGFIRFWDTQVSPQRITITNPDPITASYTLTLPLAQGLGALLNDGGGNLSWSGNNEVLAPQTITSDTTLDTVHAIWLVDTTAGQVNVTLPSLTTSDGVFYYIVKISSDSNQVALSPTDGSFSWSNVQNLILQNDSVTVIGSSSAMLWLSYAPTQFQPLTATADLSVLGSVTVADSINVGTFVTPPVGSGNIGAKSVITGAVVIDDAGGGIAAIFGHDPNGTATRAYIDLGQNSTSYWVGDFTDYHASSTGPSIYVSATSSAYNVGIFTTTPDPSSALTVGGQNPDGSFVGFLPPALSTANRNAISSPATGLEIYNTDTNEPEFWNGSAWLSGAGNASSGVSGAIQFADGSGAFLSDATKFFWDDTNFRLGIGTNTPSTFLEVLDSSSSTNPLILLQQGGSGDSKIQFHSGGGDGFVGWSGSAEFDVGVGSSQYRIIGTQLRMDGVNNIINSIQGGGTTTTNFGNFNAGTSNTYQLGTIANPWLTLVVQGQGVTWVGNSTPANPGTGNARMYFDSTSLILKANQNNVGYFPVSVTSTKAISTTYTVLSTDSTLLGDATSASFVVTLPSVSAVSGSIFRIKKVDSSANTVTVTPASGTIDGASSSVLSTQYQHITVQSDGTNWWLV